MNSSGPRTGPLAGGGDPPRVRRDGRALAVGFSISVLVHALAIVFYALRWGTLFGTLPSGPPTTPLADLSGMEIVVLMERSEPEPTPPEEEPTPPPPPQVEDEPEPEPEVEPEVVLDLEPADPGPAAAPEPAPEPAPAVAATGNPEPEGLTLAQRLQPQPGDPRIWIAFENAQVEPTEEERAQIMLNALLQSWSDSVAVAEALRNRALDWTYVDDEGRRWGIASGRLYVGEYSIPLPTLNINPNRLEDARRQWMLDDLARGAAQAEMRQVLGDRSRAILERMEEERARAREAAAGGPPAQPEPQ